MTLAIPNVFVFAFCLVMGPIQKKDLIACGPSIQNKDDHENDDYVIWLQGSKCWKSASEPYEHKKLQNGKPKDVLLRELKSTRNLKRGKELHAEACRSGSDTCIYVATALVNMYAKCMNMVDARQVFEGINHPDVVAWNALLLGYAENGEGSTTLDLFGRMRTKGYVPNRVTYIAAMKACMQLASEQDGRRKKDVLKLGMEIHSSIGFSDIYVETSLMEMYAKCGSMDLARRVFQKITKPDATAWSTLILGYVDNGEGKLALEMFAKMRGQDCVPNSITFVAALKACASLGMKQDGNAKAEWKLRGKQIHSEVGCHLNLYVQNTLIDMYAKCSCMSDAREVFDNISFPDVVSWNALMLGYVENGDSITALELFDLMKRKCCAPNSITFVAALKACSSLSQQGTAKEELLECGKRIHSEVGLHCDVYVQTTLIDMYSKFGSMFSAREVFSSIKHPNVVSWTVLILGYAENGDGVSALRLFRRMKFQGYEPDCRTFIAALKACICIALDQGKAEALEIGKRLHSEINCESDVFMHNTLIDMYAKCGSIDDARQVFESMDYQDTVSWNSLLTGYVDNGQCAVALNLFGRMQALGFQPDDITFIVALKACGSLGAIETGTKILSQIDSTSDCSVMLVTCMVDFYAKCGSLEQAQNVFDCYPKTRDVTTWNALLDGYSRLGHHEAVFELFDSMRNEGFKADGITSLCILSCCRHARLEEKAVEFFERMSTVYEVPPGVQHYNCMVDIFGRSKKLGIAMALLQSMPCRSSVVTWMTVLDACRQTRRVEIGRLAFMCLVTLDDANPAAYVVMAHIYGSVKLVEEQQMLLEVGLKFRKS